MSKEIQEIIENRNSLPTNGKAILATVVDLSGSGYRLPGAKMLITENGDTFGTVSGGCLESDVLERARIILNTNEAEVITYDTTEKANSIFSLNMGCNGIVRILIEPIRAGNILFESWQTVSEKRKRQTIATLISSDTEIPIGERIFYGATERFRFENAAVFFKSFQEILDYCAEFHENDESPKTVEFSNEKGRFEFFFENINPPLNLVIFGAGYDAIPLADYAKTLGWRVAVVDHRAAFGSFERFPEADEIIISHPENLSENLKIDKDTIAVLMTHNYEKDREIMKFLLSRDLRYIGALGPKKRAEKMLKELEAENFDYDKTKLENFHAPIGLDIGAETPEAIALAIVAEIQAVLANRSGGFLRNKKGSIYSHSSA